MTMYLAGAVDELTEDDRRILNAEGREIVVFRHRDHFYALSNTCPHQGGPVGEGLLLGKVEAVLADDGRYLSDRFSDEHIHLVCPWHGWEYDIGTGRCAALPGVRLKRYETEIREGRVYVHL
jgi:nitrite reductase/ring-hydroxylating ferredoxin subunit